MHPRACRLESGGNRTWASAGEGGEVLRHLGLAVSRIRLSWEAPSSPWYHRPFCRYYEAGDGGYVEAGLWDKIIAGGMMIMVESWIVCSALQRR